MTLDFDGLHNDIVFDYDNKIVKAPFAYPGSKTKSIRHIIPTLPVRNTYIEPFGGSGVVLLNRKPSRLEVFNDRHSGIVDFYKCIRDYDMLNQLCAKLEFSIHSRELFNIDKQEWISTSDPVERALKWYNTIRYSFGSKGMEWGRVLSGRGATPMANKIYNKLPEFYDIHQRIKCVQFENRDALTIIKEYDAEDCVMYLDPPYANARGGAYKYEMSHDDHRRLLELIFKSKAFIAVSGYSSSLYEDQDWDERFEWEVNTTLAGNNNAGGNQKVKFNENNNYVTEVLWIKE